MMRFKAHFPNSFTTRLPTRVDPLHALQTSQLREQKPWKVYCQALFGQGRCKYWCDLHRSFASIVHPTFPVIALRKYRNWSACELSAEYFRFSFASLGLSPLIRSLMECLLRLVGHWRSEQEKSSPSSHVHTAQMHGMLVAGVRFSFSFREKKEKFWQFLVQKDESRDDEISLIHLYYCHLAAY